MPEGDTIHRLARRISQSMQGAVVLDYQTNEPHLRRDDIVDRAFCGARALGKTLFIDFSGGLSLVSHLQMRGKWILERPARRDALERLGLKIHGQYRPAQLRLVTADLSLAAIHLRIVRWMKTSDSARVGAALGPDLLATDFDETEALSRFRAHGAVFVADALLRQDLLAGVGNVYKSETLFLEGLHPRRKVADLEDEQLLALFRRTRQLLKHNLGKGPRRTRHALGGPRLWVYERSGERCLRCGEVIQMLRLGKNLRSSYFCPSCQPLVP